MAGGGARALLDLRRPALPEPGVAAVLRHRRLVADLRPHVPPLRHAVRLGLDRQADQRLRLHGRDPGRPVGARGGDGVPGALRARGSRATASTPARSAPTSGSSCRTTPRTSSTGGRTGCGPRSSATSPTSTARTRTTRRSPSSPCCSRTRSTSTIATGRSTGCSTSRSSRRPWRSTPRSRGPRHGRAGAPRPPAELRRGPQLGLDRGPVEDEGGDQGRRRAARRVRGLGHRARRARGAGGHRARPALPRRAPAPAPAGVRLQGDLVARVRVQDLGGGAGADHRGGPRLPRHRLRLPGQHPERPRRPRGGQGGGHGGRRGRGAREACRRRWTARWR